MLNESIGMISTYNETQ